MTLDDRLQAAAQSPEIEAMMAEIRTRLTEHALSILTERSSSIVPSKAVLAATIAETIEMALYATMGMQARLLAVLLEREGQEREDAH